MALSADDRASLQVRAIAAKKLEDLKTWAAQAQTRGMDFGQRAHLAFAVAQMERFQKDPKQFAPPAPNPPPDGPPIGSLDDGGF